jgi:TolB-like protein/Tfp pilus assembly protein PilF/predicted Ser/Thr protein kinase
MPGQLLGRYRIEQLLGKGGLGAVYRARDLQLDRLVAIKLLAKPIHEDSGWAELLHEARTVSALNHPNICTVYEAGEEEGHGYICMEYVEGETLNSVVHPGGLPPAMTARYGAQIAEALHYAHQRRVVHRDVKSQNIAITSDGRVKLLDFGLAQRFRPEDVSRMTASRSSVADLGPIAGTLPYLAPEILHGKAATPQSDLWSLGVVLHEMSTGQLPFAGATAFELSMAIMDASRVVLPARVPQGVRSVVEHCLEKDPARRYETAGEIAAALLRSAERATPAQSLVSRFLATAGVLSLAAVLAFAFLQLRGRISRRAPAPALQTGTAPVGAQTTTVAVIPFRVVGDKAVLGPRAETFTQALALNLSQLEGLYIVPTETLTQLDGRRPIEDVARQFGVNLTITGTVEGTGDQVRVLITIEDPANHKVVWTDQFSGSRGDLLGLEDRVLPNVIRALGANGALRHRPSVAVLALRNSTGRANANWLSTALSEMLTSELAAGEQLRAVPGENVARLKLDLQLGDSDSLAPDTLARIHSKLGADYVVLGSFTDLGSENGGNVRLDLRLQEVQNGVIVAAFAESGTEAGVFDLVSRAGARLRQALKAGMVPENQAAGVRAALPSNPEVAKLYADGLARLRAFDAIGARPLLESAVARDPQFPLAHSALAIALHALGYDAQARAEAKNAFDLSASLNREERLVIEGRYRSVANQWDRAQEVYRTLFGLFPEDLDYGLSLVTAEMMNSRSDDVIATLDVLRQLPPPANLDPSVDLAEAYWAESVSDFRRELEAATRAVKRGQAQGAALLVARAQLAQATALWRLGRPEPALAALRSAGDAFASRGDRDGEAQAALEVAQIKQDQGRLADARDGYEQALKAWRAAGDERGVAVSLNNLGLLRWQQADAEGASQLYDQALSAYREIGDEAGAAETLNNAADVLYGQGQIAAARRMYEDSAAKYAELGDKGGLAETLTNIALVLANQGDLAASRSKYEQAASIARELGTRSQLAQALEGLGDVTLKQGDLGGAGKWYEQALTIRRDLGEKGSTAETRLDLAWLALEQGRLAEAQAMLTPSIDELRKEGELDLAAYGEAALALALLGQGRQAEASAAAERARALAEKGQSRGIWLMVAIAGARVEAASNDQQRIAEARQTLTLVESEASKLGFVDRQLEARLALAEIDLKGIEAQSAGVRLAELQRRAQQLGFGLIAQKARRLI